MFFGRVRGVGGEGGRSGGRGKLGVGVDGRTEEQAQTNLLLQLLQCINVQVMSLTSSIYDHFVI